METTGTLAGVFYDIASNLFVFGDGPGGSSIEVRGRGCRNWRGGQFYRSVARGCGRSDGDWALDFFGSADTRGDGCVVFPIDDFRSAFRFRGGVVLSFGLNPLVVATLAFHDYVWETLTSSFNLYIFLFLFSLVGMVHLLSRNGGLSGLVDGLGKVATSRRKALV